VWEALNRERRKTMRSKGFGEGKHGKGTTADIMNRIIYYVDEHVENQVDKVNFLSELISRTFSLICAAYYFNNSEEDYKKTIGKVIDRMMIAFEANSLAVLKGFNQRKEKKND
jgi:hypothetical protein